MGPRGLETSEVSTFLQSIVPEISEVSNTLDRGRATADLPNQWDFQCNLQNRGETSLVRTHRSDVPHLLAFEALDGAPIAPELPSCSRFRLVKARREAARLLRRLLPIASSSAALSALHSIWALHSEKLPRIPLRGTLSRRRPRRPTASILHALVSAPGAKRPEVQMRPQRQMQKSVRPPLEHRAPGSQNCRHPRKPRCSGSQSVTHPLCETYHGRKGGINQGQHFPNF